MVYIGTEGSLHEPNTRVSTEKFETFYVPSNAKCK